MSAPTQETSFPRPRSFIRPARNEKKTWRMKLLILSRINNELLLIFRNGLFSFINRPRIFQWRAIILNHSATICCCCDRKIQCHSRWFFTTGELDEIDSMKCAIARALGARFVGGSGVAGYSMPLFPNDSLLTQDWLTTKDVKEQGPVSSTASKFHWNCGRIGEPFSRLKHEVNIPMDLNFSVFNICGRRVKVFTALRVIIVVYEFFLFA